MEAGESAVGKGQGDKDENNEIQIKRWGKKDARVTGREILKVSGW